MQLAAARSVALTQPGPQMVKPGKGKREPAVANDQDAPVPEPLAEDQ